MFVFYVFKSVFVIDISVVTCFMTYETICVFKPSGKGKRLPEVHCIVSKLGCFNLFAKVRQLYNASAPLFPPVKAIMGR